MKKILIVLVLFLLCMPYRILIADDALSVRLPLEPLIKPVERATMPLQAFIDEFSTKYAVSGSDLYKVLYCESRLNENAIGDNGLAHNVAQFHEETFNQWSKKGMGENLNWDSAHDQIKVMAWAFSQGHQSSWTCSRIVGLLK